ncbi:hypothetical protein [Marinomonas posidonica]|uniref:Uncharacterized protein n=1 Tax=Marinomonas posidonica (strain CECT 7376 / NCIMB 14433 / IVIA-Po-181) TaxID=491952 RepID=F6CX77_MARPP|nr:hypothetical protein [Marinomonas posidonica]AEF54430.1 hypothetical protein Mar181_1387 [Marinomonas posidonica IVIA-Po-181]
MLRRSAGCCHGYLSLGYVFLIAGFADPSPGHTKGLGCAVLVNGQEVCFACAEDGAIDFSVVPKTHQHRM